MNDNLTPKAVVAELDRHIVGQADAKRAVAVALRNRWRRQRLPAELRDEVSPKNILMIGPTGCGKTEISRRLAKLADAPFVKVEATKFTEVGYVGRDVEQIARDLVEEAVRLEKVAPARGGAREGRGSRDRAAARRAGRQGSQRGDAVGVQAALRRWPSRRQGSRDRGRGYGRRAVRDPRHGRPGRHDQPQRHDEQGDGPGPDQAAQAAGPQRLDQAGRRGGRPPPRPGRRRPRRAARRRGERHRLPRRDRQDRDLGRARRLGQPRGRAARPAAADRGHHRRDQIRADEDRPYPVHRQRRLPRRQAVRPAARAAGPAADPGRAEGADRGGFRPRSCRPRRPTSPSNIARCSRPRASRSNSPRTASPRSPAPPPR